jgi:multiple sugar transport system permease protein
MRLQLMGLDVTRWLLFFVGLVIVFILVRRLAREKQKYTKILFLVPAFMWIIAFIMYPLLYSFFLSFFNWQGQGPKTFVGFLNFVNAMRDYKVWASVKFTTLFFSVAVTVEVALGLLLAVLVHASRKGTKFFRTVFLLPLFIPPVALGFLSFIFLYEKGPVNQILYYVFRMDPVGWTSDPKVASFTIIALDIWEWTPFCFIIVLAGLQMVPDDLIEAAYVNTNNPFKVFWHVSLPYLKPSLITVIMLRSIEALKIFDIPFVLTYGGPGMATESYSIHTYKTALKYFDLGYASALSFIFLIFVLVVFNLLFKFSRFTDIYE